MSIQFSTTETTIVIFGQTFMVKEKIKNLGGRFNFQEKTWTLPLKEETLAAVKILCGHKDAPVELAEGEKDESLRSLMQRVAVAIDEAFPSLHWVTAEIEQIQQKNGTYFMSLVDAEEGHQISQMSVKCILWRETARALNAKYKNEPDKNTLENIFQEHTRVRICVRVGFYKDRGNITLTVEDIDPQYTQGQLALLRVEILKKLAREGLTDRNKSLRLPRFPLRIGLISAEGSRAVSDFIDQLKAYNFPGTLYFVAATMQGQGTKESVLRAFSLLEKVSCDAIVLTRGGGSAADLRWFDDEGIGRAVALSACPVICAIGHHDDTCVAEIIAFQREKTPTAAADFLLHSLSRTLLQLEEFQASLHQRAQHSFHQLEKRLDQMRQMLFYAAERSLQKQLSEALLLEKTLEKFDPKPWLAKGWTQLSKLGKPVLTASELIKGDAVAARFIDGSVDLEVRNIRTGLKNDFGKASRSEDRSLLPINEDRSDKDNAAKIIF